MPPLILDGDQDLQPHPALRRGGLRWVHVDADSLVFLRETADEAILVLARRAPGRPVRLPGLGPAVSIYGGAPDLPPDPTLPGDGPTFQVWRIPPLMNMAGWLRGGPGRTSRRRGRRAGTAASR